MISMKKKYLIIAIKMCVYYIFINCNFFLYDYYVILYCVIYIYIFILQLTNFYRCSLTLKLLENRFSIKEIRREKHINAYKVSRIKMQSA